MRNPVCRDIDLSFCEIGPGAGRDCGLCLRRSVVQWTRLNLEGNDLGKDGANPIFWALRRNCSLKSLDLSSNDIGPEFGTSADRLADDDNDYGTSLVAAIEMIPEPQAPEEEEEPEPIGLPPPEQEQQEGQEGQEGPAGVEQRLEQRLEQREEFRGEAEERRREEEQRRKIEVSSLVLNF